MRHYFNKIREIHVINVAFDIMSASFRERSNVGGRRTLLTGNEIGDIIPPRIKMCFLAAESFVGEKSKLGEGDVCTKYTLFQFVMLTEVFAQ